eukprot:TRINITY_DN4004_c0_g2_i1.p1 TRINITY_DN4004_c0_g2~~TRINITY_DN4004_c0_g2_i1.p1  ORF type:complete len:108 (-),score=25.54 TRINITY_DN4004_c0_g2_i1:132-455(-)
MTKEEKIARRTQINLAKREHMTAVAECYGIPLADYERLERIRMDWNNMFHISATYDSLFELAQMKSADTEILVKIALSQDLIDSSQSKKLLCILSKSTKVDDADVVG